MGDTSAEVQAYVDGMYAQRDGDFSASTRRSPTTPLSWSGGGSAASPSAADGFEETSKQVSRSPPSRSKGSAGNETTSTNTKRSRRKKTFAELKEEENLLLKERVNLKREMASMRATYKEQRARNENLKRIKLDLNLQIAKNYGKAPLDSCNVGKAALPDLNTMPVEDDSVTETLYGTT